MHISLNIKYVTFAGASGLDRVYAVATAQGVLEAIAAWQAKQPGPVLIVRIN